MPQLSVVIPVYNTEKYIVKCVDSILGQTQTDIELIIVDDGSADCSSQILDEEAFCDDRIIIVHGVNNGVSSARNIGMGFVSGEYVTFVDSDDWIENNYYESVMNQINDDTQLFITGVYLNYKESINIESNITHEKQNLSRLQTLDMLYSEKYFKGFLCNKVYRTNFVRKYRIQLDSSIKYCEDVLFNTEYILRCGNIVYLSEPFYHYRIHGSSATEGGNYKTTYTGIAAYSKMRELLIREKIDISIIRKTESSVAAKAVRTIQNMGQNKTYDAEYASNSHDAFIKFYNQYFEIGNVEKKIIAVIFKISPYVLYLYFCLRYRIRSLLKG